MKKSEIPQNRLDLLNSGLAETANLTEWLAVDQAKLLRAIAKERRSDSLLSIKAELPQVSVPKQIAWIGAKLHNHEDLGYFENHVSDVVRNWACYGRATASSNLKQALHAVKSFAADSHFGVREVAWMSIRGLICEYPLEAIDRLMPWAKEQDEMLRRFATEATRPRGVWAKHIDALKKDPSPGRPLLDLLSGDSSRYVQNSVANWLNDAAKDHPDWVKKLVRDWSKRSSKKETKYIIQRALRSMK